MNPEKDVIPALKMRVAAPELVAVQCIIYVMQMLRVIPFAITTAFVMPEKIALVPIAMDSKTVAKRATYVNLKRNPAFFPTVQTACLTREKLAPIALRMPVAEKVFVVVHSLVSAQSVVRSSLVISMVSVMHRRTALVQTAGENKMVARPASFVFRRNVESRSAETVHRIPVRNAMTVIIRMVTAVTMNASLNSVGTAERRKALENSVTTAKCVP